MIPREIYKGVSKEIMPKPPTNLVEAMVRRIDVAEVFKHQDLPTDPKYQPLDYTATPLGAVKTGIMARPVSVKTGLRGQIGAVKTGLISQEGLHKRKEEAMAKVTAMKTKQKVALANAPMKDKPVTNVGFLGAVDKFFNWLNRLLGE